MRLLILPVVLITLFGCASATMDAPSRIGDGFSINYQYVDNISQGRINLSYTNSLDKAVCIGPESWPSNGILLGSGATTYLEIEQRRFYLREEQDYCPNCTIALQPGGVIVGHLNYSSFGLTRTEEEKLKTLNFHPKGFDCA